MFFGKVVPGKNGNSAIGMAPRVEPAKLMLTTFHCNLSIKIPMISEPTVMEIVNSLNNRPDMDLPMPLFWRASVGM